MNLEQLINILEKKYSSAHGFMGVQYDIANNKKELFELVKDEICSTEINLDGGYEEDIFEMTKREARGYITRLNNFLKKYGGEI